MFWLTWSSACAGGEDQVKLRAGVRGWRRVPSTLWRCRWGPDWCHDGPVTPGHTANPVERWRVSCSCWTEPVSRIKLLSAQKAQEEGQMFPRGGGRGVTCRPPVAPARQVHWSVNMAANSFPQQQNTKQPSPSSIRTSVTASVSSSQLWWVQPSAGEADASVRFHKLSLILMKEGEVMKVQIDTWKPCAGGGGCWWEETSGCPTCSV